MFSRRHYTTIAKVLGVLRTQALDRGDLFLLESIDQFTDRLIETFRRDNPAFRPDRFLCAVRGSV